MAGTPPVGGGEAPTTLVAAALQVMSGAGPPAAKAAVGDADAPASSLALGGPTEQGGAAAAHLNPVLNPVRLWDGLPTLMGRELPFGVTKLLVYAATQDTLLGFMPAARERPVFALAVSLASGIVAGLAGAFVSHPADTIVTRVATGGFGRDWQGALKEVLASAESDDPLAKTKVLYTGVAQRCVSLAIVVTAQFVLFDGLRGLLAVSQSDLSLVLDIFEDRLDFYDGWDEISGSWVDAIDNLDYDLFIK